MALSTPRKAVIEENSTLSCLSNCSISLVGDKIYAFGGFNFYDSAAVFNNLHCLDLKTMQWTQLGYARGTPPRPRNDHSATPWRGRKLIIFGGYDDREELCNDVHVLDIRNLTWEQPTIHGPIPPPLSRHAATIHEDKLFIHGGKTMDDKVLSELYILDLRTWTWQPPIKSSPRESHFTVVYRNRFYIYGGLTEEMERPTGVTFLDLSDNQTTEVRVESPEMPPSRGQHFSQLCGSKVVVLVTHSLTHATTEDDENRRAEVTGIWSLDLTSQKWRHYDTEQLLAHGNWHYFASSPEAKSYYLLGTDPPDGDDKDEYLGTVLEIDLEGVGLYNTPESSFGSDIGKLFNSPEHSDFKIFSNTPDAPPVQAHQLILKSRWKHFSNLIASGCRDSRGDSLTVPEPIEVVRAFVRYLYTDTLGEGDDVDYPLDVVCQLLVIGNLYCIPRLQRLAADHLDMNMNVHTVSEIFAVAITAGERGLKERCLTLMRREFGKVVKTEGFRSLTRTAMDEFLDSLPTESEVTVVPSGSQAKRKRGDELLADE
ncbi:hypothetical protein DFJ74DRAFT_773677 [Hyaloraphidium curvatum]|nr:hypothetical protein DFJ74DRAFT_773677 [Hyaloraphidium curvatum]